MSTILSVDAYIAKYIKEFTQSAFNFGLRYVCKEGKYDVVNASCMRDDTQEFLGNITFYSVPTGVTHNIECIKMYDFDWELIGIYSGKDVCECNFFGLRKETNMLTHAEYCRQSVRRCRK